MFTKNVNKNRHHVFFCRVEMRATTNATRGGLRRGALLKRVYTGTFMEIRETISVVYVTIYEDGKVAPLWELGELSTLYMTICN